MNNTRTIVTGGRHRLGDPGLTPVGQLVSVSRRGFFASLFTSGKHAARTAQEIPQVRARTAHAI